MLGPNRMNVIVLAALLGLTLGLVPNAQAQIQEVKVEVKGLSCPFCVKGVEKHLKKVEGVKDVSTSLKKGEVTLHYKLGTSFDLKSIEKAVVRGGFTPGPVELRANGKISRRDDDFLFTVTGTELPFVLHSSGPVNGHKAGETVSEKTKAEFEQVIAAKQSLEITGQVHSHKDARPGLSVERVKKVSVEDQGDE